MDTAAKTLMTRMSLAEHLEEEIISGHLASGEKLPSERQLAEQFGVSRPLVREALRTLVERNLVEVQPGRGAFVRSARASDAAHRLGTLFRRSQATPRNMVEARTMLECTAAALAAERRQATDLDTLNNALSRFNQADGLIEQTRHDLVFHLTIARSARNPVIETMFGSIRSLTVEMMLRSLSDAVVAKAAVPYHHAIFEAIRDEDAERARTAMADHLSVAASFYGDDYDRNLESVAQRKLAKLLSPGVTLDDLLDATGIGEG